MTCKQCGTVVNENQSFCACCGAPLDPPAEPVSRNPEPAPDPSLWPDEAHSMNGGKPDGERPKKKPAIVQKSGRKARERKNGSRALWIILPIAALLLIAAVVFIILFLIKEKDVEPADTDRPAVSEPTAAGKTDTSEATKAPKATEVPTVSFRDPAFETAFRQAYSLMEGEACGSKLNFLVQEMNREVNTIGSKAMDTAIAQMVVDAKSEIEKLREQIQNVE